jgi:hypothetical protein
MDVQLKNYSSGMQMRLAFAVAANLDPDVLLLDEIFAVGDEEFQKQCRRTIEQFLAAGKTILFVSHSSASVRDICQRVCLLEHGRLLYDGSVDEGLDAYQRLMLTPPTPISLDEQLPAEIEPPPQTSPLLDFLRAQGLSSDDYVLEIGGADRALRAFVESGHYFSREPGIAVDAGLPPIDVASAPALLTASAPEMWGPVLISVVRALSARGRLFVTRPSERPLAVIEHIAAVAGGRMEPLDVPGDEAVLVITRIR